MSRTGTFAPGQGEQRIDVGNLLKEENRAFFLQFFTEISNEVIDRLRVFFEIHPRVPPDFRFVYRLETDPATGMTEKCDTDQTPVTGSKISITEEFNSRERFFPAVLVAGVSANIRDLYLGRKIGDLVQENSLFLSAPIPDPNTGDPDPPPQFLEVGERLGGKLDCTVTLHVVARNVPTLEALTDLVLYALVGPVRRKLEQRDLIWLPNQGNVSGIQQVQYTNVDPLQQHTITFGLQAEWHDDFYYEGITVAQLQAGPVTLVQASGDLS